MSIFAGRARRTGAALSVAVAFAASSVPAHADERTAAVARDLAVAGRTAYAAGDYARARELFHRAYDLLGAPTVAVYEARSLVHLGRLVDAAALYRQTMAAPVAADAPDQFQRAVADASRELAELEPRIPVMTLTVTGIGDEAGPLAVTLDGAPADPKSIGSSTALDPGRHRVEVGTARGTSQFESFSLSEGERRQVHIAFIAAPPPKAVPAPATAGASVHATGRNSWMQPASIASLGVGVAGIGAGVVLGLVAAGKHSDAEHLCPGGRCTAGSEGSHDAEQFRDYRTLSTIGYAVGILGVAGGVTLFVLRPSHHEAPQHSSLDMFAGPACAGLKGMF